MGAAAGEGEWSIQSLQGQITGVVRHGAQVLGYQPVEDKQNKDGDQEGFDALGGQYDQYPFFQPLIDPFQADNQFQCAQLKQLALCAQVFQLVVAYQCLSFVRRAASGEEFAKWGGDLQIVHIRQLMQAIQLYLNLLRAHIV